MPRRSLHNLKNLGSCATPNTKRTTKSKNKTASNASKPSKKRKEKVQVNTQCRRYSTRISSALQLSRSPPESTINNVPAQTGRDISFTNDVTRPTDPLTPNSTAASSCHDVICLTEPSDVGELEAELEPEHSGEANSTLETRATSTGHDPDVPVPSRSFASGTPWDARKPPSEKECREALIILRNILHPRRDESGRIRGFKQPSVSGWNCRQLQDIEQLFNLYTAEGSRVQGLWTPSADTVIIGRGKKAGSHVYASKILRKRAREFLQTRQATETPFHA